MNSPTSNREGGLDFLGIYRFLLASAVVISHLWNAVAPDLGRHAVVGFFCVSGFLVTKIASETYLNQPFAFLANRALRIFPVYWAVSIILVLGAFLVPSVGANQRVIDTMGWLNVPTSGVEWANDLLIFRLFPDDGLRLVPQAWSLEVELLMYLVIGLVTSRSRTLTYLLFATSLILAIVSAAVPGFLTYYYSGLTDGYIFFSGSLVYWLSRKRKLMKVALPVAVVAALVSGVLLPLIYQESPLNMGVLNSYLFVSAAIAPILIWSLMAYPAPKKEKTRRFLAFLGKLAYPLFLLHQGVAVSVATLVESTNSAVTFFAAYVMSLALSIALVFLVEKPIEEIRKRIRQKTVPH